MVSTALCSISCWHSLSFAECHEWGREAGSLRLWGKAGGFSTCADAVRTSWERRHPQQTNQGITAVRHYLAFCSQWCCRPVDPVDELLCLWSSLCSTIISRGSRTEDQNGARPPHQLLHPPKSWKGWLAIIITKENQFLKDSTLQSCQPCRHKCSEGRLKGKRSSRLFTRESKI